ncbi:hypothetical protein GCM10008090_30830 [Arenicella chitinivorans]|uniref:Bacteriophage T5 Orf172 DNA-binding domain-containing protein n=1 Tax=Arenicella chitinivorans TaxID=1329800 RepID=A0A918S184_9GAMM|nr:GIY-YIG nuclease family protein [Arenicella chitinivorans]GHA18973.1 hypothetical protein GCM10008090_30830 [Arenicella chitinivorans]
MNLTQLYLLIFPEEECFKIGKANDVFKRSKSFAWLAEPDYDNSYSLTLNERKVYQIEKALHLFLDDYSVDKGNGDGHTEVFEIEGLTFALEHIATFSKRHPSTTLKKGIEKPAPIDREELTERKLKSNLVGQVNSHSAQVIQLAKGVELARRVINIFIKRHHRIPYQFTIKNEYMYLRFPQSYMRIKGYFLESLAFDRNPTLGSFSFKGRSVHYLCGMGDSNVFEYKIPLKLTDIDGAISDTPLNELIYPLLEPLTKLPSKSKSLKEDLEAPEPKFGFM